MGKPVWDQRLAQLAPDFAAPRRKIFPTIFLLTVLMTVLPTDSASAHRLHAAMTTVLFNDRTERIEIMHRFYLHDAEQLATEIAGSGANLMDDPEDRQRFGIYVHERFELYAPDGSRLPVTLRGTEVDGDFLWVYQAMRYPSPQLNRLAISHLALRDLWPDQVNSVNIERDGRVQTLTFRDAVDRLFVEF
jgi:hypothetical protein